MPAEQYHLHLNNFDGPLDLLLTLVRDKHMDILNIDLVQLAGEYIRIIDRIKNYNIDLAAEYLVMAASLLQIKARALLATPAAQKFVKEAQADILKKLVEHQQFKNLSRVLRAKEGARKNIFIKEQSPLDNFQYEVEASHLDGNLDAIQIIIMLRKMFERTNARQLRETTIERFNLSPAERRVELIKLLTTKNDVTFLDIFTVPTINHFVVTVITILDMARKQELIIKQTKQFGTITFKRGVIDGV